MQTITEYYQKDHDEIDQYLTTFETNKDKNFLEAKDAFRAFISRLKRHIVWEEAILFPFFETKTGMKNSGPTEVMRMEHREIKGFLTEIHKKVHEGSADCNKEIISLRGILEEHNQKEENVLYPGIDRLISEEEKQKVFQDMDQIPLGNTKCQCSG